ncbi:MAG: hypothetical protein JWN14_2656, partial [Chthonomonadales bacterium]|nr:hypothetical protein [Chthonomonadales bacterium]
CEPDETFCDTFLSDYRFLGRLLPDLSKKPESEREIAFSAALLEAQRHGDSQRKCRDKREERRERFRRKKPSQLFPPLL